MPLHAGLLLPRTALAKESSRPAAAVNSRRNAHEADEGIDWVTQVPPELQRLFSATPSGQPAERQRLRERVEDLLRCEGVSQLRGSGITPKQLQQLASQNPYVFLPAPTSNVVNGIYTRKQAATKSCRLDLQIVMLRCIRQRLAVLECLEAVPKWTEELAADAECYGPLVLLHLPVVDYQPTQGHEQRRKKRRRTRHRRRHTPTAAPEAEWSTDAEEPIDVTVLPRGSPEAPPVARKVKLPPLKRRRVGKHKENVSPTMRLSPDADDAAAAGQEQTPPPQPQDNAVRGVPGSKPPSPEPKRKPGRPRKGTEPAIHKQVRKLDFSPPAMTGVQKPGAPRKPGKATAHGEQPAVAAASQQKRKPGRPRKQQPEPAAGSQCGLPAAQGLARQKQKSGRKAKAAPPQPAAHLAPFASRPQQPTLTSPSKRREQRRSSSVQQPKPPEQGVARRQKHSQASPAEQLEQALWASEGSAQQQNSSAADMQLGRAQADVADKAEARQKRLSLRLQEEAGIDGDRVDHRTQQKVAAGVRPMAPSTVREQPQAQPEDCYDADTSGSGEDHFTELLGGEMGLDSSAGTEHRLSGVQLCSLRPVLLPPVADDDNFCSVCGDEDGDDSENEVLLCEGRGCQVAAHQQCYGVPSLPSGKWLCDGCSAGISPAASACALCPCSGGALRRVTSLGPVQPPTGSTAAFQPPLPAVPRGSRLGRHGSSKLAGKKGLPLLVSPRTQEHSSSPASSNSMQQVFTAAAAKAPQRKMRNKSSPTGLWAHSACVLWSGEATFGDPDNLDDAKLDGLTLRSINLPCSFCRQGGGSAVQCSAPKCSISFHPLCARSEGCVLPISKSANTLAFCLLHSHDKFAGLREGLVADDGQD